MRALARAEELCGGRARLAANLGISESRLAYMLDGWATVPDDIFLRVVDILSSPEFAQAAKEAAKRGDKDAGSREA